MNEKFRLERTLFLSALMFYTRIPVPAATDHSQSILNRSRKYFTVIGVLIGGIAVTTCLLANQFFGTPLSIALSMLATILATGAFHEDGFADSCDGLGGGWTTEQVLTIMKDSRVGTYATVGLISALSLKFLALWEVFTSTSTFIFALIYINGHTLSRQLASRVIEHYNYVQDIDLSKVKPITERSLSGTDARFSYAVTMLTLLPLMALAPLASIIAVAFTFCSARLFMRYCNNRIGGYTGDILGAVQQLSELSFYLTLLLILPTL